MQQRNRLRRILILIFFVTGTAGLVYEVVWTRLLALAFGSTVFAVSTVLVSFMAGLAVGAFFFGRLCDRVGHPLKLFALLELGVAATALLMPVVLKGTEALYAQIYRAADPSFASLTAIRFFISLAVLMIPTSLMGGTLPALVKFFAGNLKSLGYNVAVLYSVNTFGAVCGASVAGFVLIGTIGIIGSTVLAVLLNLTAGGIAFALARANPFDRTGEGPRGETERGRRSLAPSFVLMAIGFSGFAALAYEVIWTRSLSIALYNTTYSFTAMLTAFLAGIALGSILFARVIDRWRHPLLVFGVVQWLIGISAISVLVVLGNLPAMMGRVFRHFDSMLWQTVLGGYLVSFQVMLVSSLLMGLTIPLAVKIYTRSLRGVGASLGKIYSSNTTGCILGSLSAGFLLIPLAGIRTSALALSLLNVSLGFLALLFTVTLAMRKRLVLLTGLAALTAVIIPFMTTRYRPILPVSVSRNHRLIYYEEGVGGTVSVSQNILTGEKLCFVDNSCVIGTSYNSLKTVRMLGHLPLIFCEHPERVLIIGYGMGVTSHAVSLHSSVKEIRIAEIAPAVIDASVYFQELNMGVLKDPRVNVEVEDGRIALLLSDEKYDCITCDPTHPVLGSGALYTREYFELCRDRLEPGGTVAQYLPMHVISSRDFRSIVRTFSDVFPNSSLWLTFSHCVLLGKMGELQIDYSTFEERLYQPRVARDLSRSDLGSPPEFLSSFVADAEVMLEIGEGAPPNTDYNPRVEFSGARSLKETWTTNLGMLTGLRVSPESIVRDIPLPERETLRNHWLARGESLLGRIHQYEGRFEQALEHYRVANSYVSNESETRMLAERAYRKLKAQLYNE